MANRIALTAVLSSAVLVVGASAFVAPQASETPRADLPSVHPSDIALDAARSFAQIDVDQNAVVDFEEFAAQQIVYAEIVRRDRRLTIEGTKSISIPLSAEAPAVLTAADRRVLTANARAVYHRYKDSDHGLSRSAWTDWRSSRFEIADRDNSGFIEGEEAYGLSASAAAVTPRS